MVKVTLVLLRSEGGSCGEGNWFCSGVLREGAVVKVNCFAQEC